MPIRFERWMRSKLSAITARTPRSAVPFAAQSRDEPVPYSLPAMIMSGVPSCDSAWPRRRWTSARRSGCAASRRLRCPGTSWLRRRMLANVPRIMTS